jgi:FkbM family methyltransferase
MRHESPQKTSGNLAIGRQGMNLPLRTIVPLVQSRPIQQAACAGEFMGSASAVHSGVFRHPIGRFERDCRRLYASAMRRLGFTQFLTRAQGALFIVDPTEFIDRHIACFGMYEGPQMDDLARVCRTRSVDYFLDIGANSGFYSIMLATKGLAREVIAFEPDPGNYAHLIANLYVNGLTGKVRALPYAVGAEAATVTLQEAGAINRGESWIAHPDKAPEEAPSVATHEVRQVRFDDEFAFKDKTIVMKMDVEGSEFHALAGMRRTLRDNLCYAQVELYSDRLEELKAVFASLGYRYLRTEDIDHFFTNMADV